MCHQAGQLHIKCGIQYYIMGQARGKGQGHIGHPAHPLRADSATATLPEPIGLHAPELSIGLQAPELSIGLHAPELSIGSHAPEQL